MPFLYKKVLVIGATSGIGAALASKFIEEGSHCIVVGRRTEKLESFVKEHGSDKATAITFDISDLKAIPAFASSIIKSHPDLDCVFLNSGIQRPFDFSKPETVDLDTIEVEFRTNYLSYIHLTKAFLPHLQQKAGKRAIVYTSSGLALVPLVRCPNYNATKAALHQFTLCLREQVKESGVKVVEIMPPAVQTELHDEKHQPDIKNGRSIGMPLGAFVKESYAGLERERDEIPVGDAKTWYDAVEPGRQKQFRAMVEKTKSSGK